MQVTKTREEFFAILRGLNSLGEISGFKIAYAIARIRKVIRAEEKIVSDMSKPSEEYTAFNLKRAQLAESFAQKDANGNALTVKVGANTEYDITPEDRIKFEMAFAEMKKGNEELIEKFDEKVKALGTFLLEEVTLDFYNIKKEDIPGSITVSQMDIISPFVVDLED